MDLKAIAGCQMRMFGRAQVKLIFLVVVLGLLIMGCAIPPAEPVVCEPEIQYINSDAIIIAYTDTDKYFCECFGVDCPCYTTDEILSQLG